MAKRRSCQSTESKFPPRKSELAELMDGTKVPQPLIESVIGQLHMMEEKYFCAAGHKSRKPKLWVD